MEEMDGLYFKIGAKSFFQTNSKQAKVLYRKTKYRFKSLYQEKYINSFEFRYKKARRWRALNIQAKS